MRTTKTAVVTGSTKGIGRAILLRFLEEGYFVVGNYSSDDSAAKQLLEELSPEQKQRCTLVKQELSSAKSADRFTQDILELVTSIDCLVLNCGTTDYSSFRDVSAEKWQRVLNVNLTAPFFIVQRLYDTMNSGGGIVFVSSHLAKYPHARSVSYSVSKSGVNFLAECLVKEFAGKGVRVNSVMPGFTDTQWHEGKEQDHRKRIEDKIAVGRFGDPAEIARAVYDVITNTYINGACLDVHGGYDFK